MKFLVTFQNGETKTAFAENMEIVVNQIKVFGYNLKKVTSITIIND